ncbi:MAG: response regulator [Polyangia bacterium]
MREIDKDAPPISLPPAAQLLLVEDEPILRSSMARGLSKLPSVEVWSAATVAEARQLLDSVRPQIVLCDIDLPDGLGLDILAALDRRGLNVPVIFISAYVSTYRRSIPSRSNIQVREKPFPLTELRKLVQQLLALPPPEVAPFSASDYVQLAWMGQHSVRLEFAADGEAAGCIVIFRGEVWSAVDRQGAGEGALRRLLFSRCTLARCVNVRDEPGPREFTESSQSLLMEAARLHDEELHASRTSPPAIASVSPATKPATKPATMPSTDKPPLPEPRAGRSAEKRPCFEELFEQGVDALLRKNYAASCEAFAAAAELRPGDTRVVANLKRLRALGFAPKKETP